MRSPVEVPIDELSLDLENPRFGLFEAKDHDEALRLLVTGANVKELWASILSSGFERYEPLIALDDARRPGELVVIEGNRRLAACKTLLEPHRLGAALARRVPELPQNIRQTIETLPVVKVNSRSEASAYIGFKHVNGPATWSSLAKARFGVKMLEDSNDWRSRVDRMKELTQKLGDSRGMLLRVFVAFKIYQQAIESEIIEPATFDGARFQFSHLYTMLNHPPTRDFIGLPEGPLSEASVVDQPIPEDYLGNLRELFDWLFGEGSVIRSQGTDRPRLQKVIASTDGLEALRSTSDLNYAYNAAGLESEDWFKNLSLCMHMVRKLDAGVIEIMPRFSDGELSESKKKVAQAGAYMRSIEGKLNGSG